LVQGKPNSGTIEAVYPVILKLQIDKYAYLGHYKVVSRKTVPVQVWEDETEKRRINVAKDLANTKWGEQLLRAINIELQGSAL
jgi:Domain of unknown function (DUF6697)